MPRALAAVLLVLALTVPAGAARSCGVAVVFAIDVSGSVDAVEYRLQIDGLAAALRDPEIAEALERTRAAVTVVQWSGVGQQQVSVPWTRTEEAADVAALAARVARLPRAFDRSDTAVGELIHFAAALFDGRVADCARRVIDISGDGSTNAGRPSPPARSAAQRAGIEINAVAIEIHGPAQPVTEYFRRHVVTPGTGFVMTARNHDDYAATLRAKILRELVRPLS